MTTQPDEELVEAVARAIAPYLRPATRWQAPDVDRVAEAKDYAEYVAGRAIAVIAPTIRNKALDDAANVAEIYGANAAKAILALKAP